MVPFLFRPENNGWMDEILHLCRMYKALIENWDSSVNSLWTQFELQLFGIFGEGWIPRQL